MQAAPAVATARFSGRDMSRSKGARLGDTVAAVAECVVADGDFGGGEAVAAVAVAAEPVG